MSDYPPPQNPGSGGYGGQPGGGQDNDATQHIPPYQPGQGNPGGGYGSQPGQPGYGSQPGQPGYGSQPGSGTPAYGTPAYGTPAYGTPAYGTPAYGTPGYGTPAYGAPGGPGGPGGPGSPYPPAAGGGGHRNAIIAGIVAVVVVAGGIVAAIALTSGNDSKKSASSSGSPSPTVSASSPRFPSTSAGISSASPGGGAAGTFATFVGSLEGHDVTGLKGTLCSDGGTGVQQLRTVTDSDVQEVQSVTTTSAPQVDGSTALAMIVITTTHTSNFDITLAQESAGWCVKEFVKTSSSTDGNTAPSASTATNTATGVGIKYFAALQAHYLQGIKDIACGTTRITLQQSTIDQVDSATPDGLATTTGDTATMTGKITIGASTTPITVYLKTEAGTWCLSKTASN